MRLGRLKILAVFMNSLHNTHRNDAPFEAGNSLLGVDEMVAKGAATEQLASRHELTDCVEKVAGGQAVLARAMESAAGRESAHVRGTEHRTSASMIAPLACTRCAGKGAYAVGDPYSGNTMICSPCSGTGRAQAIPTAETKPRQKQRARRTKSPV